MEYKAYCLFAEDVRQEVGNKSSLMGVYSGTLFVETFPTDLQGLWVCAFLTAPYKKKFNSASLIVRLDEENLAEHVLPKEFIQSFWDEHTAIVKNEDNPATYNATLPMHIMISPLVVDKPAKIEIKLQVDEFTITAGSLNIYQQL